MHDFFRTRRFVGMLALMMGLTAMSIDAILPAFPSIIEHFSIPPQNTNSIQLTVLIFMIGFSTTQFVFGVLADIYGRRSILLLGLSIYVLASIATIFSSSYEMLLIARFLQGVGVGAPRVLTLAIVRDVVSGRAMSRLMSFVMMVFLIIPIIAPMVGQWVMFIGGWQSIFVMFASIAIVAFVWCFIELPETLAPEQAERFSLTRIFTNVKTCLSDITTLSLLLVLGLLFGSLVMYISQFELIFQSSVYAVGEGFVYIFAGIAFSMVFSALTNSKFVMYKGLHKMLTFALAVMFVADSVLLVMVLIFGGKPPILVSIILFMMHFFAFSILMPNFNSLIMQPYKVIAGTASALIGSIMTLIGVGVAHFVGQQFNNTLYPLSIAYFVIITVIGIISLLVFKNTEELPD